MLVDGRVTLPLVDEPVADSKFKPELLHVAVEGIEMLMVHHARRNMHGIALIPVVPFAADLRVAVAFEGVQVSFRMRMAVALGVRQVDKDRADRDAGSLEAVLFAAPAHQKIGRSVFGFVRFFMLLLMHRDAATILRPVLGLLSRKLSEYFRIIFAALLELLQFTHVNISFEMPREHGEISDRGFAGIEELMR